MAVATNLSYLLQQGAKGTNGLDQLRYAVLADGIPSNHEGMVSKRCLVQRTIAYTTQSELRIYVWLVLLGVTPLNTDKYLDLVRQGASPSYAKIRNDTFRTLATDPMFRRRVTENSLTRVLNAVAWKLQDAHEARVNGWQSPPSLGHRPPPSFTGSPDTRKDSLPGMNAFEKDISDGGNSTTADGASVGYVQGMNVLAAPFLYSARSEVQAFAAFSRFIATAVPGYIRGGSMDGVHRGLALVDTILAIVDPKLSAYLISKGMKAEIYGFASVLTLCACTPPLPEVLNLWDFLFAYGPHLNLLCIVAQLVLIRDQLLANPRYGKDESP
jgi:cell cycle arrest protein BUB2